MENEKIEFKVRFFQVKLITFFLNCTPVSIRANEQTLTNKRKETRLKPKKFRSVTDLIPLVMTHDNFITLRKRRDTVSHIPLVHFEYCTEEALSRSKYYRRNNRDVTKHYKMPLNVQTLRNGGDFKTDLPGFETSLPEDGSFVERRLGILE